MLNIRYLIFLTNSRLDTIEISATIQEKALGHQTEKQNCVMPEARYSQKISIFPPNSTFVLECLATY